MTPRDFALLAAEAYTAPPDIGKADSASRAIVRHTDAGLCVAFRGSDDIASWIADLDAIPVSVPGMGIVHQGFWQSWQAISGLVMAAIGDQPVTLTGHSLGGSISLLAAAALTLAGKPPITVYAFEPARVSFDLSIRNVLAKVPLHLYKNGNDLVVDLPPGGVHPALLTHIGTPLLPLPNVADHMMDRVLLALA